MDTQTFEQGMTELTGAYPREFEMTETTALVWMKYLDPLGGSLFLRVVGEWIVTQERAPTIAGLLAKAKGAATPAGSADDAWMFVLKSVTHGAYRQNGFHADERVDRAVQLCGGWRTIAMTDEDRLHYVKRDFMEHYDRLPVESSALAVR